MFKIVWVNEIIEVFKDIVAVIMAVIILAFALCGMAIIMPFLFAYDGVFYLYSFFSKESDAKG